MNKTTNIPGAIIIEGHVQGLANTRALGQAGIPVVVVDKDNCIARYSKYCKSFYRCPDYRNDEFASFLVELASSENLEGWVLLPSNDHAVYTLSKFRDQLSKYFKVITPGLDIINNIYNKHNLLNLARKHSIPIPETWYPQSEINMAQTEFIFPVMVKGKEGLTFYKTTGRKVFIAANKPELVSIYRQMPETIAVSDTFIQEIIPTDKNNKTVSFTAFCVNGEIKAHWTGVKLREHPPKFGTATYTKSIKNDDVLKLSTSLLKELNYTGVCEVEYLLDTRTGTHKLIEINARTWLWVGLAIACGINYPVIIYNYLNGIEQDFPLSGKVDMEWMNRITDTFHSLKSILKGQLSLRTYWRSLFRKKEFAVYYSNDLLPSFMFIVLLPYLALKRR